MSIVQYTTAWDYPVQSGESTASGPVHTLTLTTSVLSQQTIEETDTEANQIITAVNSVITQHVNGVEGVASPTSTLDGVHRNWQLGQVGEVGG